MNETDEKIKKCLEELIGWLERNQLENTIQNIKIYFATQKHRANIPEKDIKLVRKLIKRV